MIKDLDVVVLTKDIPALGLRKGDSGAVVLTHGEGKAFEVEFVALNGDTIGVETVPADALRLATSEDMPNARTVAAK